MADKFVMPKGRQTIRKGTPVSIDPMIPSVGRENRRVRLWNFEANPGTTLARLEAAYLSALAAVDAVEERKVSAAKSGKFTPEGAVDDALQFALQNAVPAFKRGRAAIKAAADEAKALREKIKLKEPDKSDVAGAYLRREIRDRLAAMPAKERDAFVEKNIGNMDPVVAEAILTAPSWLSGVADSHRAMLTDKALQAQYGEEMMQLQELERAIEVASSAVETGRDEVWLEAGVLDPAQFDQLAAPVEKKVAAPWLQKSIENDVEVVRRLNLEAGAWTKATPEDLASGIFYKNRDEYLKDNPEISTTPARSAA